MRIASTDAGGDECLERYLLSGAGSSVQGIERSGNEQREQYAGPLPSRSFGPSLDHTTPAMPAPHSHLLTHLCTDPRIAGGRRKGTRREPSYRDLLSALCTLFPSPARASGHYNGAD